ncbi:hypothetical protein GvMRE_IIg62 [endosymbiont GvMRE of Glomus versiforme]|nr:hypothetical protein GvMRE_IIg62 [endosymbiont GvMRE of Glomus versiforme]
MMIGSVVTAAFLFWLLRNNNSLHPPYRKKRRTNPPVDDSLGTEKYAAIEVTQKHQKLEYGSSIVSAAGISEKEFLENIRGEWKFLPAGSALLTDTLDGNDNGSSILNSKGITHIIHAAPNPRSSFSNDQDFINCVVKSVQNSIIIADQLANNPDKEVEKLAIPLVGGGIYLGNCDPQKLAQAIIIGAVHQLEKMPHLKKIIFIDWGGDYKYFSKSFEAELQDLFHDNIKHPYLVIRLKNKLDKCVVCKEGDIRDKNLHRASVIVNAANAQVKFGDGVSGKIAEQVGNKNKIDQVAERLIRKFNNEFFISRSKVIYTKEDDSDDEEYYTVSRIK